MSTETSYTPTGPAGPAGPVGPPGAGSALSVSRTALLTVVNGTIVPWQVQDAVKGANISWSIGSPNNVVFQPGSYIVAVNLVWSTNAPSSGQATYRLFNLTAAAPLRHGTTRFPTTGPNEGDSGVIGPTLITFAVATTLQVRCVAATGTATLGSATNSRFPTFTAWEV